MIEAGPSTDANEDSARPEMESEANAAPSNYQESSQEMNQLIANQIENLKSEINLYSARVLENQRKLRQMQFEIDQDQSKRVELQKKLEKIVTAQSLLNETFSENSTQENVASLRDQQALELPSTSNERNGDRSSFRHSTPNTDLIGSVGRNSENLSNINDKISSQDLSDNASASSYRPSVCTQSTESQSIGEGQVTKLNLPWQIACQKLLHALREHKDSHCFRNPVDEKIYEDYRKHVVTPMCLRDIEESFQSGVYNSPIQFFKDVKLIFENSRKYNVDKRTQIYKQTTRLKKFYEDNKETIMSNWQASKKPRGSSSTSKRKVNGADSDQDDDSQSRLKSRPKRRRIFSSDDDERTASRKSASDVNSTTGDDDEEDDDDELIRTRSRTARNKRRSARNINTEQDYTDETDSDTEDEDSFVEYSDEDQSTSYETSDNDYNSASEDEDTENEISQRENENLISLTSASALNNFKCGEYVTVQGKVSKVFKTVKQHCLRNGKDLKLFKFLLKTKEGRNVECVAWEDLAVFCQSKIRRNQLVELGNVKVKFCKGKCYNRGNFNFQLVLYTNSTVMHD